MFEIPPGFSGCTIGRSGLELKYRITVHNAVIDSDYRGVVYVILINNSNRSHQVLSGERIARVVITKAKEVKFLEVSELTKKKRNVSGFGSTGL